MPVTGLAEDEPTSSVEALRTWEADDAARHPRTARDWRTPGGHLAV